MDVTLIITGGPASLKAWNGLRLGAALIGQGLNVTVFLVDDGVYLARSGQRPVDKLAELGADKKLAELMDMGAAVEACGVCLDHRGLEPDDLVPRVRPSTMVDLARFIKDSDRVVSL